MTSLRYSLVPTPHGTIAFGWGAEGVAALRLPSRTDEEARAAMLRRLPQAIEADPPAALRTVVERIGAYFDGARVRFDDVPLQLGTIGTLYASIYARVRRLGWGETMTYGQVARAIGDAPELPRVVGQAMGRNPVPLIIPCHRVLAAGGTSGGFSAPGGADAKRRMLALEGVTLATQTSFGF